MEFTAEMLLKEPKTEPIFSVGDLVIMKKTPFVVYVVLKVEFDQINSNWKYLCKNVIREYRCQKRYWEEDRLRIADKGDIYKFSNPEFIYKKAEKCLKETKL